ncbi:MAG: ABC transporter ATP-binding protein [Candidatus Hodarchaeales archaeon]|jgi:ATP-binding cassette subfamily B protein
MANLNGIPSSRLHPRYYRNFITWILGHLLKHKLLFSLGYLLIFLGTAITVIIPILLQYYFDKAIFLDINAILTVGVLFLSFYLINFIMSSFGAWVNAKFSELVVKDVQVEFFESIHSKSMSFHDSARTGELLSMATSDSRQLSWMLLSILMFILAIVTTISSLVAMYFLDPFLFLIFLVFIPPIVISIIFYGKNLGPISIKRQFLFARWQATLQENLSGIRALRTLSNRERESEKYDNDLKAVREVLIKRGILSTRYFPTLIIYFAMGIMFILGGYLVYLGEMTPGRVFSVISEQQELQDGNHPLDRRLAGKIKFENVSFRYSDDGPNVLKDTSFTIAPGQTVAVIGHTGCGKTTLQKLIQRLYDPTNGKIFIDDIDVKDYPIDLYRKQVGVIEQDIFLFSASIKENILYGFSEEEHPNLEEKMIEVAKSAQIHDYIESLPKKYDTVIGERGITLSGGQRQRLAIARAFMINPPILIMDDSTSAIDAKTEAEIQQAIKNLLESRTTIIVTHRLSTLRKADVVILMRAGMIEDIGNHKKLYTSNSEYAEMFHQFEDLPPIPDEVLTSTEKQVKEAI